MSHPLPASDLLQLHDEVREALGSGQGVVALESTILAHGLPHPDNIEIAARIESAVRAAGSVPATIAVLDGVVHVGLGPAQVERVCTEPDIAKLSIRDLDVNAPGAALAIDLLDEVERLQRELQALSAPRRRG